MRRFIYRHDEPGQKWDVFLAYETHEIYTCSFPTADEARAFCQSANQPAKGEIKS